MNVKGVEYGGMSLQLSQPRCSNESEPFFLMRRANARAWQVSPTISRADDIVLLVVQEYHERLFRQNILLQVVAGTLDVSLS